MTDRLDEIEARAKGLTDLCTEYLRLSIRHVQRNCDIDCDVHGDDYDACKQPDRYDGARMATALADIPALLNAVKEVRELANYLDTLAPGDQHYAKLIRDAINKHLEGK
jgi:hypothetical protein